MKEFAFRPDLYFKCSWYKYLLVWIAVTVLLCAIVASNGMLSGKVIIVVLCIVLLIELFWLVNKTRFLKNSEVVVTSNSVKYTKVVGDGIAGEAVLGTEKKTVVYEISEITGVSAKNNRIIVNGTGTKTSIKIEDQRESVSSVPINEMTVPLFFGDKQQLCNEIKNIKR